MCTPHAHIARYVHCMGMEVGTRCVHRMNMKLDVYTALLCTL